MMNCPRCGEPFQPGMQFCVRCGTAVGAAAPPVAQQPLPYQYPPQRPQAAPETGMSALGKAIIIGLAILIVVSAIASVLFFRFFGGIVEEMGDGTTVTLSSPLPSAKVGPDRLYLDISYNVSGVSPNGTEVRYEDVRYTVEGVTGNELLDSARPRPDDPAMYDNGTDGHIDVQAWYVDSDGDGLISVGDTVKLTGLDGNSRSGLFIIQWGSSEIATETLPNFPL